MTVAEALLNDGIPPKLPVKVLLGVVVVVPPIDESNT